MSDAHQSRADAVRSNRPRGVYVPIEDVPIYLHGGWKLLDDCPGTPDLPFVGVALLLPPEEARRGGA